MLHQDAVVDSLSPNQTAELLLDGGSSFLENETFVTEVLKNLIKDPEDEQLREFFQAFAVISKQVNA